MGLIEVMWLGSNFSLNYLILNSLFIPSIGLCDSDHAGEKSCYASQGGASRKLRGRCTMSCLVWWPEVWVGSGIVNVGKCARAKVAGIRLATAVGWTSGGSSLDNVYSVGPDSYYFFSFFYSFFPGRPLFSKGGDHCRQGSQTCDPQWEVRWLQTHSPSIRHAPFFLSYFNEGRVEKCSVESCSGIHPVPSRTS